MMTKLIWRRPIKRLPGILGASASMVIFLAACGGGSGGSTTPTATPVGVGPTATPVPLTISVFVNDANMVCLNASQYATAEATPTSAVSSFTNPTAADLPAIATYFTGLLHLYQGMITQLQALGAPPSNQAAWTQALTDYQTVVTDFQAAQTAAQGGDVSAYTAALAKESTDNAQVVKDFNEFGATMCATDAEPQPV